MDVEWFELNVLKWMEKTLKRMHNVSVIIEIRKNSKSKQETLDYLKSLWFTYSQIDDENRLFKK